MFRPRAFALAALAALLLSATSAVLAAAPAAAHATLVDSSPVDNEVVDVQPATVQLTFDEAVNVAQESILVLDATGNRVATGRVGHIRGRTDTAEASLPARLADGTYVVSWRVGSADSHIITGAFRFSVGAPSAVVADPGQRDLSRVVAVLQGVARAAAFLGLAGFAGGALFVVALWPDGAGNRRARRVVWTGLWLLIAGTVATFLLQGPATAARPLRDLLDPGALELTLQSRLGPSLVVRLLVAGLLALWFTALTRTAGTPGGGRAEPPVFAPRTYAALLAAGAAGVLLLAGTWTWSDHSRTGRQQALALPLASVHLIAMTLWLGGLAVLVACVLLPTRRLDTVPDGSMSTALARFSQLALVSFATLAVTGSYLAWRQVETPPALVNTKFGWLLLGKLALVLVILTLAAGARAFVRRRPDLVPDAAPSRLARLRRGVVGELALGVAVLGVTAALVGATPARNDYAPPVDTSVAMPAAVAQGLDADEGSVRVEVAPARPGANVVDVYLMATNGRLLRAAEVTGRLDSENGSVKALPVDVSEAEPGHYVATDVSVPFPGRWTLRLDVRVSDFDEYPVTVPFSVR